MRSTQQNQQLPRSWPKRQAFSVREAERHLDADVFLDKCLRWPPLRSHCPFIMHQMFTHAKAMGQKEHDWAICQDWQQPSPKQDLGAESLPTWNLLGLKQLGRRLGGYTMKCTKRVPSVNPSNSEMVKDVHQEIPNSVKEHLQCRWEHVKPEGGTRVRICWCFQARPQSEFQQKVCATYDHFKRGHVKRP